MRFSPAVLLTAMTALVLAGCASTGGRVGSTTKRTLTWPGKDLPSDRIAAEEREAAAAATAATTATTRSFTTRRTGTGSSTYSGASTAVPGVGHTVILIQEPVLFPHGYHHHGYHYPRGRTYRHRYPHANFPSGGYRPSVRSQTILLDATSGRSGPSHAPSAGGSPSTPAPGSNIAPTLRQSDFPAYRP